MTKTISVRLNPEEIKEISKVEKSWKTDRSEAIRRLLANSLEEWKLTNALEKLREHKISIGKAAEECNISLWEIMDMVKEKNIDWTGYGKEDLARDLALLK